MRLDRYLCEKKIGSRSEVKQLVKKGVVTVNRKIVTTPELHINETEDAVAVKGIEINRQKDFYFMLNKPGGIITASRDKHAKTVLDLFADEPVKNLYAVGRLDKDTEGFLLITNDGPLGHNLLSPKKHVPKTYEVTPAHPLSEEDLSALREGVDIGDETRTLPCEANIAENGLLHLTIYEGRFHQVKRMLEAVNNSVNFLKRISFGPIPLDKDLNPGSYRPLTEEEINLLKNTTQKGDS